MNVVQLNIFIKSNNETIWKVITNEESFFTCFKKLRIKCDSWEINGVIKFYFDNSGNYDKALIKKFDVNRCLSYEYFKHGSSDPILVSFKLTNCKNNCVNVNLESSNFISTEEYLHTKIAWQKMLSYLKLYAEEIS